MYKVVLSVLLIMYTTMSIGKIVHDPITDADVVGQLGEEISKLESQLDQLRQTYQKAQQIEKDATGHYGFGNQLNSSQDWQNRQWTANTWQESLQGLSGGNQARYQELLRDYQQVHPTLSESDFEKGASEQKAQLYNQSIATNQSAMTQASYEYEQLNALSQQLSQLAIKIEDAQNSDTKSAIDLNSRLIEAVANIQLEELKMQTLLNEQLAQAGATEIAYQTQEAKFNALPEN